MIVKIAGLEIEISKFLAMGDQCRVVAKTSCVER